MDKLSQDDQTFLTELRHNAFLEREEAYHKINLELEKKTSAIIEKIEKYSTLRQQRKIKARDDRTASAVASCGDFVDPNHQTSDSNSEVKNNESYELITLYKSGSGDNEGTRRACSALSTTSMPSSVTQKLNSFNNGKIGLKETSSTSLQIPGPGGTAVERRQQSRLQKATESVVHCLQSKLVNYETRLTELHLQHRQKIQENTMLESKVRAMEEERERLLRTITSLQGSLDKQAKIVETCKSSASTRCHVVDSMRKEIDGLKREQKQNSAQVQSLLTRLNRTIEENERLKAQNKSVNFHLREVQTEGRSKAEEQNQRIVGLEQERTLLGSTIAKQAHLLKNLCQQKVILEVILEGIVNRLPTDSTNISNNNNASNGDNSDNNNTIKTERSNPSRSSKTSI